MRIFKYIHPHSIYCALPLLQFWYTCFSWHFHLSSVRNSYNSAARYVAPDHAVKQTLPTYQLHSSSICRSMRSGCFLKPHPVVRNYPYCQEIDNWLLEYFDSVVSSRSKLIPLLLAVSLALHYSTTILDFLSGRLVNTFKSDSCFRLYSDQALT